MKQRGDAWFVGLVVEGSSDERTVDALVCRTLETRLRFRGVEEGTCSVKWTEAAKGAPRTHGRFNRTDVPMKEDGPAARNALQRFVGLEPQPRAVVLVRDSDGKLDERRNALALVTGDPGWPFRVLFGVPHTKRECWVLAALGASKMHESESRALAEQKRTLGFDPTKQSDKLSAAQHGDKRSAKAVLQALIGPNNKEREEELFENANLAQLRKRGESNGLAAFLDEIDGKLRPLLRDG